nr:hypothetical protein [Tanacetum cinerariifolium]
MVEKEFYNELSNIFLQLEKHCFSLEISIQQKEESFQTNKPCKNQESPEFRELFKINELKAQLQAKNSTINNLKKQIKNVHVKSNEAKFKHNINVLETINIELESSAAKLLAENEKLNKENEHLKQTYKELFYLRIHTKDHNDSPIAQVNICLPVDVINDLSKLVTPHYVPKVRESVFVRPHQVIAYGSSRNSSNESYRSNDMARKYYLEVAKKKTQDKSTSLKPSVRHTTSLQNTTNGSKPKPRSNNQTSRSFSVPKSSYVQSSKTKNINKPIEPKSHTQKPDRQIAIGQMFSLNKSSAVCKKLNTPRSCIRWIPTGRIFKTVGLRWIPTGNMFTDSITKVDSEPSNGSNEDITNPYECKQSLDVSACTLNLSAAYDGEINIGMEENMNSNEFAVKLCLEHEVKRGNKVVKKELIIALRGEIYFVKFIINPEEDDVEPGVIFGRSFLRLTKAITDFETEAVTIYTEIDPFLEDIEEEEKNTDE